MNQSSGVLWRIAIAILFILSTLSITACADEVVDENVIVVDEAEVAGVEGIDETSVEEAVEAREEGEPPGVSTETVEPVGEPIVEGIEEQVEEQIDVLGETVTLAGTVSEEIGERTFVFAPATGEDPLLVIVINDELPSEDLQTGSTVTISGAVVAAFYIEDVEKTTGLDLDDDLLDAYQGGPAIVATSVALAE